MAVPAYYTGGTSFRDDTNITAITIPNNITTIENYAFSGCTALKSVTFEINSSLTSIGDMLLIIVWHYPPSHYHQISQPLVGMHLIAVVYKRLHLKQNLS